ncbi:MAG: FAD-dependent oxidoreductase [Burkholderiales bacterium]|nr:FAD-dependent oxidoreductase [Burkholderiales bacterium]
MRIAVIGAGIVGVTTAYELASDGHEVTVYERRASVAAETSFAIAGMVSPGYVTPWAAPGMRRKVLCSLFQKHPAVHFNPGLSLQTLRWMSKWWRACGRDQHQGNRASMQALAVFSHARLRDVTSRLKLDYERTDGCLLLLRTDQDLASAQPSLALLRDMGIKHSVIDREASVKIEPGLNPKTPLHAAIHLPDDEVGNCRQFAHLLRTVAQNLGVSFRFHTEVDRIVPGGRPELVLHTNTSSDSDQASVMTDGVKHGFAATVPMAIQAEREVVDAIVVCAAMDSSKLLVPHGLKLPLIAVHGYSVTAPMRQLDSHPDHGPQSGIVDDHYKVAISRLGSRIRVAGCTELGGHPTKHNMAAIGTLYKVLDDWYPGIARLSRAQSWKGARPMLPDGPPVLGLSGLPGVWLNLGHGSNGWALACGSARVLADLLAARAPAIDTRGLGIDRFRR